MCLKSPLVVRPDKAPPSGDIRSSSTPGTLVMQATTAFSPAAQAFIANLCKDLTERLKSTVNADYGQTECGEVHDVALCVESLPAGSWGHPGPLASILTGPGIPGGFVILDAQGIPTVEGVPLEVAVQAVKSEVVRGFREALR